jgi:hypothetical protein
MKAKGASEEKPAARFTDLSFNRSLMEKLKAKNSET